ncbi:MAG: hypothetical protein SFX73_14960 [Kofleriaceae bacterium]|nr:hypothetical protein [Kofleriaceae bacterium]
MRKRWALALAISMSCTREPGHGRALDAPRPEVDAPTDTGEDVCAEVPVLPEGEWRHTGSSLLAAVGDPHHRGRDLVAATTDATQVFDGKLTYGPTDKDLQDEDVDVYACFDDTWRSLGTARTDDDGRFTLTLTGERRLPAGLRDLYLSVVGDRTGARALALVAPAAQRVLVSDIDGTLTESENEYPVALATGTDTDVHPHAAEAFRDAAAKGIVPIYISARGDRFTQDTRDWLAANGFPRGPIHLPRSIVTIPGEDTIAFKTAALDLVEPFELVAGIGNRATDVAAYKDAGLPPGRILIKLDEFAEELAADLAAGRATGFPSYDQLPAL